MPSPGKKTPKKRNIAENLLERFRESTWNVFGQRDVCPELLRRFENDQDVRHGGVHVRDLIHVLNEMRANKVREDLQEVAVMLIVLSKKKMRLWIIF
jgi:hypothetical protein